GGTIAQAEQATQRLDELDPGAMTFEPGGLYFIVWYGDEALLYLSLEVVVFIGRNLDPQGDRGEEAWYFQDVRSYSVQRMDPSIPLLPAKDGAPIATGAVGTYARFRAAELEQVTDLAGLVDEIENCRARRMAAGLRD